MVVHVCCQKIRHGRILIWEQNSFGLTVCLEHCLVEEGLKSKCCRSCEHAHTILWSYSSFHPCLLVFHKKGHNFLVWCHDSQFLSPANYLASVILVAAPPEFVFGWLASLNKPWQKIQLKTTHLLLHNMGAYGCSYLEEKITVFICWSSNVKMDWHHKQNHKCT